MATKAVDMNYTLNESEVMSILNSPKKMIKESTVFNDIKLSHAEKVEHASDILNSRK